MEKIELNAIINKISTTPDHGFRLALDLGEESGPEIAKLMTLFRDKILKVSINLDPE